mmetsp:Transcript_43169/g.92081  ORF Transcript_43169/g.92081 Transcript_43169/m.92081 type:complete len:478 (+) Transcript_43169:76-1509(+)
MPTMMANFAASIAFLLLTSPGAGQPLPARPTEVACPECSHAHFTCDTRNPEICDAQGDQLHMVSFNFTYASGQCWEEIPLDSKTMYLDIDLWCHMGAFMVDCSNMNHFSFSGISMLDGCTPNTGSAAGLIEETCEWQCKNGRPASRCTWSFDKKGIYGMSGGVERCWIEEQCGAVGENISVGVTCKPTDLWQLLNTTSAALGTLRQKFIEARADLGQAQQDLQAAVDVADPSKTAQAVAARQAAEMDLQQVTEELNQETQKLQTIQSKHDQTTQELLQAQVEQEANKRQLAALILDLQDALTLLSNGGDQQATDTVRKELDVAAASYLNVQKVLDDINQQIVTTHATHDASLLSLRDELAQYKLKLQQEKNKAALAEAQRLEQSKADEEKIGTLTLVAIILGSVLGACCLVISGMFVFRKKFMTPAGSTSSAADNSVVVVGRPVDAEAGDARTDPREAPAGKDVPGGSEEVEKGVVR